MKKILTCNSTKLSIFANLVGWACANRVTIDVYNGLLPHVKPDQRSIFWPFVSAGLFNGLFKAFASGLSTAKDLVSWDTPEVWYAIDLILKFLDFIKVVEHSHGLPYFGVFRHLVPDRSLTPSLVG